MTNIADKGTMLTQPIKIFCCFSLYLSKTKVLWCGFASSERVFTLLIGSSQLNNYTVTTPTTPALATTNERLCNGSYNLIWRWSRGFHTFTLVVWLKIFLNRTWKSKVGHANLGRVLVNHEDAPASSKNWIPITSNKTRAATLSHDLYTHLLYMTIMQAVIISSF